jgi:hypothetical protein
MAKITATDIVNKQYSYDMLLNTLAKARGNSPVLSDSLTEQKKNAPKLDEHPIFKGQNTGDKILKGVSNEKMYTFVPSRATFNRYYSQYVGKYDEKLVTPINKSATIAVGLMSYYKYALEGTIVAEYEGNDRRIQTAILYDFDLPGYIQRQLADIKLAKLNWEGVFGLIYQLMAHESAFAVWQINDTDTNWCYGLGQYKADRFFGVLTGQLKPHIDKVKGVFKPLEKWLKIFDDRNVWEFWKFAGLPALMTVAASIAVRNGNSSMGNTTLPGLGEEFVKQVQSPLNQLKELKAKTKTTFDAKPIGNFFTDVQSTSLAPNQVAYLFYLTVAVEAAVMVYEKMSKIKELANAFYNNNENNNNKNNNNNKDNNDNNNALSELDKGLKNNLIPLLIVLSIGFDHLLPAYESTWRKHILDPKTISRLNGYEGLKKQPTLDGIAAAITAELLNFAHQNGKSIAEWLKSLQNSNYFIGLSNSVRNSTVNGITNLFSPSNGVISADKVANAIRILGLGFSGMARILNDPAIKDTQKIIYPLSAVMSGRAHVLLRDSDTKRNRWVTLSWNGQQVELAVFEESSKTNKVAQVWEKYANKDNITNVEWKQIIESLVSTNVIPMYLPSDKVKYAYKPADTGTKTDSGTKSEQKTLSKTTEANTLAVYKNNFDSEG